MNPDLRKRYEALEPRYKFLWKGTKCYYCGQPADTVDHAPAISVAYSLGADRLNQKGFSLWKVSCCKQCNSILGDRFILSLEKRGRWLYNHYIRRYAPNMKGRDFTKEELEEFGHNLRSYLINHQNVRTWLERRFSFMENFFGIAPDSDAYDSLSSLREIA